MRVQAQARAQMQVRAQAQPPEHQATCFKTPDGFDQASFIKTLKSKHGFVINGGYGKIKGLTFRISNMGNETAATMQELITAMDDVLG